MLVTWNEKTLTSLMQTSRMRRDRVRFYPQGHLEFNGGAGPGVFERKTLSQRQVLLRQQAAQRHRQITQGAFVLVIFHLCALERGEKNPQL